MNTIHPLMYRVLSINIMVYIANAALARNNNSFFIIFPVIFAFYCLRTYKERINTFIFSLIPIATSCSYFS